MACKVGITIDPVSERAHWKSRYPNSFKGWKVLAHQMTYAQALSREGREARERGCTAEVAGACIDGRIWSVYHFEY